MTRRSRDNSTSAERARARLHAFIRTLHPGDAFRVLHDVVDVVSDASARQLDRTYLGQPERPAARSKRATLDDVRAFADAVHRGEYFESFNVNSQNYHQKSAATLTFIDECQAHFAACVSVAARARPGDLRAALDSLLDILRALDRGEDLVFFADEGGSWNIDVDWKAVLPAYFATVAATAGPEDFATLVLAAIEDFEPERRGVHIRVAARFASAEQARALRRIAKR